MKRAKFLSFLLTFAMLLSLVSVPALAAEKKETTSDTTASRTFEDVSNHWGKASVERWASYGVLNGDPAGNFNPDAQMTRAEFATTLVNMLGYTERAENTFADVPADAWFADAVLKLAAAGVMKGDGTNANPNAPISRQEAAVLLCRAFNIESGSNAKIDFADGASVANWASDAIAALTERDMIAGVGDNKFAPLANITRASVAKLVDNMVSEYVTADKEITGAVKGLVVVVGDAAVTLKDAKLSENLIIAPKAGKAVVTLTGKTTAGNIYVQSDAAAVKVEKDAAADAVLVDASKATVQVSGKVESVSTAKTADGAVVTVGKGGSVDTVVLSGSDAKLDVTGTVKDVEVSSTAKGSAIAANQGGKITNVTTSAEGVKVSGNGTVSNVTANAGSVSVTTKGTEVKNDGGDKVTANGKDVTVGNTVTTPSGGGGGGGGSSHRYAYTVTINGSTGGTVTADVTQAEVGNTKVTLTVQPDDGWKLKTLTVTGPDGAAVALTDNAFTMTAKGNYAVTAEFVQPLTKFDVFPVATTEEYEKLNEINSELFPLPAYDLTATPWLAIHAERGAEFTEMIKVANLTITRNGTVCTTENKLHATEFGTILTAYIGNVPEADTNPNADYLGLANKSGYYEVSVVYEGVTYTDAFEFTAKGETPVTVKFVTDTDVTVASYPAVTDESIPLPEAPEIAGKVFVEWQDADETAVTGPVTVGTVDATYTAHYIDITDLTVSIRKGTATEDGVDADYTAAYAAIGAEVNGGAGVYTVSVDAAKLAAVAADTDSAARKVLENTSNPDELWVGMNYTIPTDAKKYKIAWDEGGFAAALAADARDFVTVAESKHVFDYQSVWKDNDLATKGQDVFVIWLNEAGKPIAAEKAEIKFETRGNEVTEIKVVDSVDGFTPVTVPQVGQKLNANVTLSNDTEIGVWPVDKNLTYKWYYAESTDTVLGTEPVYTVTADNVGKTICVDVTGTKLYRGTATWSATAVVGQPSEVATVENAGGLMDAMGEAYIKKVTLTKSVTLTSAMEVSEDKTLTLDKDVILTVPAAPETETMEASPAAANILTVNGTVDGAGEIKGTDVTSLLVLGKDASYAGLTAGRTYSWNATGDNWDTYSPVLTVEGDLSVVAVETLATEDAESGAITEFEPTDATPSVKVTLTMGTGTYECKGLFVLEVAEKDKDKLRVIAVDTDGDYWNILTAGWGAPGFELANATTTVYLQGNTVGTYTATLKLVDASDESKVLASTELTLTVKAARG